MNEVDIRPSLGDILNSYKRYTYHPETAIAEFVDNSTASYFLNKNLLQAIHKGKYILKIEINYNSSCKTLTIKDNAFGMDYETFKDALTIAKRPKNTKGRNEYGMGLKTAASWFAERWTIETSRYGDNKQYYAEIDIPNLMKNGNNSVEIVDKEYDKNLHGTVITLMELNRTITAKSIEKLILDLESIYRKDLNSGDIEIIIDGKKLKYVEPEILTEEIDGITCIWKQEFDEVMTFDDKDYKMNGFIALRQEGSYKETGFTLLRRNRVIIGGLNNGFKPEIIFGSVNSFMSLRLFGEVNLDDWPVTQAKDNFDWEINGLKDAFIDRLYNISKDYIEKAKSYRVKQNKENAKINSLQTKEFADNTILDIKKVSPDTIEIVEDKPKIITDKDLNSSYILNLRVLKNDYNVKVTFINDTNSELFKVNSLTPEIEIIINSAFPLISEMNGDKKFLNLLQKYIVLLVLSEQYAAKISTNNGLIKPYKIREVLNQILMEISENGDAFNE